MRRISRIVVHCTAGNQRATAADVAAYHTRSLGWHRPGYHYVVEASGAVVCICDETYVANGVRGYNSNSIHVCYTGGVDLTRPGHPPVDNRTAAQRESLLSLLRDLRRRYPQAVICSHRDLNRAKACPSFDATHEYASL